MHTLEDGKRAGTLPEKAKHWLSTHAAHAEDVLMREPRQLADMLDAMQAAVPFAHVLNKELAEVAARRTLLWPHTAPAAPAPTTGEPNPWERAREMNLLGLALSGGGIRSATHSLGILQALAERGWLAHFDYLSTVSGGGYIGSWLTAWIKRSGSVHQVQSRLNPAQAPNPRGEEVRPIRWLRSYSNYLSPEASILSTDAWTVGATWLRNALLNQLILALVLGGLLSLVWTLYRAWVSNLFLPTNSAQRLVVGLALTAVLMLAGGLLNGLHMRAGYNLDATAARGSRHSGWWFSLTLAMMALVGLMATYQGYFFQPLPFGHIGYWYVCGLATAMLVLVALVGRYHRCFFSRPVAGALAWALYVGAVLVSSFVAAYVGTGACVAVWHVLRNIHSPYVAFVVGPPLLVQVLSITAILRMALLGRNFPDERREWWGRFGAMTQQAALAWLVLAGGTLLAPVAVQWLSGEVRSAALWPATTAAWLALVGKGVQMAQSAATPSQPGAKGTGSWHDVVARTVPYVFLAGVLVLLACGVSAVLARLDTYWPTEHSTIRALISTVVLLALGALLASRIGVNEFSMHHFYKNRLMRAYLGASRRRPERRAHPFTGFDIRDDVKISSLRTQPAVTDPVAAPDLPYTGPLHILNTTLNVTRNGELAQQDRQAESFVFTPLYCGFDFSRDVPVAGKAGGVHRPEYGFRPTEHFAYADDNGPGLATALAISGAAANPNQGFHSSPVTAFLLTVFNVRLGWWMGNPHGTAYRQADPPTGLSYLLADLFGRAKPDDQYVNLSDGGHFDNLGLYELVRRRCRYIVVSDTEEDADYRFEALANAIRRCRVDFGVEISLAPEPLARRPTQEQALAHAVIGHIRYPDWHPDHPEAQGWLLYFKATLTGNESADVREYAGQNRTFPHETTADQFFSEPQFESYRRLGYCAARDILPAVDAGAVHDKAEWFRRVRRTLQGHDFLARQQHRHPAPHGHNGHHGH
ncbi:hypothetical protein F0P96_17475 [Hymenobacter busanensis]|uniref:Uncharacterized protein n=2 Tax=Hymenobacter busanensis TaxID=2607656 RepID=A0A7L5A3E0_9BACT|nr:hypothetical protein F0P96_17475 [Hymenobacter busanensis]QHJ09793.1 hypothetical protein GUY19_20290 [Hymenobacter busanensis]